MRSEGRLSFVHSHSCAEKMAHEWGTRVLWNMMQDCACLRERSGWRWELFSI